MAGGRGSPATEAVLLADLVAASAEVAATRARNAKIETLARALARAGEAEVVLAVAYLSGVVPQGAVGVGWAALRDLPGPAGAPSLALSEVDASLEALARAAGKGARGARRSELERLFARATAAEQRFLVALLLGELRQGALAGLMTEAVARAAGIGAAAVRRAAMVAGDLGEVAVAALAGGEAALARFRLAVLTPVQPMLAQSAASVGAALARLDTAAFEHKLDGARLQVHKDGAEVRAFTRNLADASARVPEVLEAVAALPARSLILDGEAIALNASGRPRPFQETMSRFGSRLDVERLRVEVPLSVFFFDLLHLDGDDLLDLPGAARAEALRTAVPAHLRVPRTVTADEDEAQAFLDGALAAGHEGVMAKSLDAPYEAGRRGASWLKVKPAYTLDLVVLAAEWGHGRRRGYLSNLHLAARDPAGGFVMLGKTFKGLTDDMLAWQTERLLALQTRQEGIVVHVRPELVVEVAFDGLQKSSRYPAGLALRFARVKGYRLDKDASQAGTIDAVRALMGP